MDNINNKRMIKEVNELNDEPYTKPPVIYIQLFTISINFSKNFKLCIKTTL